MEKIKNMDWGLLVPMFIIAVLAIYFVRFMDKQKLNRLAKSTTKTVNGSTTTTTTAPIVGSEPLNT